MPIALFINGVFEDTLDEILAAQSKAPSETFFLQPYAGEKIKLLAESAPSPENKLQLYLSVTDSLAFVSFRAKIVGWQDKRQITPTELDKLNQSIKHHQPSEKEIYLTAGKGKPCVNLIHISQLERIQEVPVSCFVKESDKKPLKRRKRSGGWSYVYEQPEWLGSSAMAVDIDVRQELDREVEKSLNDNAAARMKRLATAQKKPEAIQVLAQAFRRNADVIAEVLFRAAGKCQRCEAQGPFFRASDGSPYLEVHHKVLLSQGGEDTVENAIAMCPNCHREMHFGKSEAPK